MDEIEFPQSVCINSQPHGPHRIAGTWRTECPGIGDRIEVGADGCGCPITEEVTPNGASVDGTEQVEHRGRCWEAGPLAAVAEVWRTINSPKGFRPVDVRPLLDRIEQALRAEPRQFCRKGAHTCAPAVTLTFDNGTRRLHWCAEHAAAAEQYRSTSDRAAPDQWIAERVAGLTEAGLLQVKAKLDEIAADRPVVDRRTPAQRDVDARTAAQLR